MKLNRKHLHALDIAIHKVLTARDSCNNPDETDMLTLNANRLRQLRILMLQAITEPGFDFGRMFHDELCETLDFVKGIRLLTGNCDK